MLESFFADIRYSLRWLRRSPGFALIAIASLAIGIGFNTTLFTLVDALLFRPLPVERPNELVDVFTTGGDGDTYATSSYPDFLDFKAQNQVFGDMLAYSPSIDYNRNYVFLPDRHGPNDKGIVIDVARVAPEYFATIGVPILQGRNFTSVETPKSPGVVIVNDALARKYWPNQNAIGKRIRLLKYDGTEYEVVGVSADYKVSTVGETSTPYIHYAVSQRPDSGGMFIARTRGDASALLNAMRRELLALEPNLVFLDNQTMDTQVAATLLPAKAGAMSVSAVGVVAMLLASIGLYGVIAYAVARRTREIGIRMALGAKPGALVCMVMRQGLSLAAVGVAVGALLALGAAKAIAGALYGVSFVDPIAWTASIAMLFFVAAMANLVPARRASAVDPSIALRSE